MANEFLMRVVGLQWRDNRCRVMFQEIHHKETIGDVMEMTVSSLTKDEAAQLMHLEFTMDKYGVPYVDGHEIGRMTSDGKLYLSRNWLQVVNDHKNSSRES